MLSLQQRPKKYFYYEELYFFALFALIGCISCSQEYSGDIPDVESQQDEVLKDDLLIERSILNLSSQDAYKVADLFSDKSVLSRSGNRQVKEVQPVLSATGAHLMYLVNYADDNGYVIVGASKNYAPILAYSEEGNLQADDSLFIHDEFINEYKERIEEVLNVESDSLRGLYALQWSGYESEPEIESRTYTSAEIERLKNEARKKYTAQGYDCHGLGAAVYLIQPASRAEGFIQDICHHTASEYDCLDVNLLLFRRYYETYGPELETAWHQDPPYCADAPNSIAGCATIAVGQIMKYHEWPARFDWNNIRTTMSAPLTSAERGFLNTIRNSMNPKYEDDGTTISKDDAMNMLANNGYTVKRITTSGNTLRDNLAAEIKAEYPLFLVGAQEGTNIGHSWVCDGYRCEKVQYAAYMIESFEQDYIFFSSMTDIVSHHFHMNIGANSKHNKWYYLDNVNPAGKEYNSGRGYYSVRPNR